MLTSQEIRIKIDELSKRLEDFKHQLNLNEANCGHGHTHQNWSDAVRDDIVCPGGICRGTSSGAMGDNSQLSFPYPEIRTKRWKRICNLCGYVQYTKISKPTGEVEPVF